MSETVPLESVSRWSGLSPWVALLPWRMAGAASPRIKSGATSAEGRVRGKPPESSPGQAPSCIGAQIPPPAGVGEKTCAMRVGLGEEGWKPAGERAEEAATPVRGVAWWNGAPVQAVARRRRPRVQAGHLSAPFASRVVNRCLGYASAGPLSGQGRGQAFAKGLSPRRLRPETSLPGFQRIPRTASTSSVPPFPVGTRAAACPAPWL